MKALLACVAVVFAALAVTVEPARACSCIPPDPWSYLKQADGAFVGRLVNRQETDQGRVVLTFGVERRVKGQIGSTVEVTTANNSAACGIEMPVGRRIGLFLLREGGRWVGHLCWVVEPEDLLAAATLPAPNGKGPVALFIGGRFGPARTLALDARGRTLAYGMGSGSVLQHSACPGGTRVVELVARRSGHLLAIRDLPTFWLIREQRLPDRDYGVSSLRCVDARGEKLALFSSGPDARGLLSQITPRSITTIWRGRAFYASFWKRLAFVQVLARAGTRFVAVDLGTGTAKTLGTVRAGGLNQLTPNSAGTRLAGDSYVDGSGDPRLVVVDLARRPISARTISLPTQFGGAEWLGNDRFAYFGVRGGILVYSAKLRFVAQVSSGWTAFRDSTVVGFMAYGLTAKGALVSASLPSGPVRVLRRLPGEPDVIISAGG